MPRVALADLLDDRAVLLDVEAATRDEAIRLAAGLLVGLGAVGDDYADAMIERDDTVSTVLGEGVAVPHGTLAAARTVVRDAIAVVRLVRPVDWNGAEVSVVIGLAARGRRHIGLLSQIAGVLLDAERAAALRAAASTDEVRALFAGGEASTR